MNSTEITFGSVCSGIEAVSVAVKPFGWRAEWFAEIEAFPCAVLKHHYPTVPNLGDMTKIAAKVRAGHVCAPDVLVGGTPCQAFSIAGMRAGLSDARGALTLSFVELANEIDATRLVRRELPCVVWWENVPGVLSSKDNAFGCFLGALAGEDDPLEPPGGKWANAGCVFGPQRAVAWRITDAQYFGVAQRRRRVFVVASAREGFDPAAILFEFEGVRRDSAPSRETRQDVTGTLSSRTTGGGGLGTDFELGGGCSQPSGDDAGVICMAHGQGGAEIARERSPTLTCNHEAPIVVGTLQANGKATGSATQQDAESGLLVPIAFDSRQDPVSSTDVFGALGSSSPQAQAVAFSCKDHGADATLELAPTMRAMGHQGSHANAGGQLAVCITGDVTHTLKAEGFDASEDGTGRRQPIVPSMAFAQNTRDEVRLLGGDGEIVGALAAQPGMKQTTYVAPGGMAVRRLTPTECERLQSFPDGYTAITVRGKPAADGPRYKALGNSMCVFNMRWIGRRIDAQLSALIAIEAAA